MARIISIVNQKGGTGKSACTANLAVGLAQKNMKVLIVDADPQSDVSAGFGYRDCDDSNETLTALMDAVMKDEDIPSECFIRHQAEGIDIICSNIGLAGTEVQLVNAMSREYVSSEIPTFQTVARSSLAYTAFFWIIGILFATIFFTKEYNTGTIKLSVAYGTKRTILYYTKAITILVVSLITYLIFVATFFVIEIIQSGYIPTASEVINLLGWALACGTVLLAFESISIFLCVVIQNTGIVTGICCLYVFSGASVYLMLWSDMETVSIPLKFFVYGNPMYYWMNFSSCRTMGIIEHLPFYFIGCISLLIVGGLIMTRKEIK